MEDIFDADSKVAARRKASSSDGTYLSASRAIIGLPGNNPDTLGEFLLSHFTILETQPANLILKTFSSLIRHLWLALAYWTNIGDDEMAYKSMKPQITLIWTIHTGTLPS